MSQNRRDMKDRPCGKLDYNIKPPRRSRIENLSRKLHLLTDKVVDVEELLRRAEVASKIHWYTLLSLV